VVNAWGERVVSELGPVNVGAVLVTFCVCQILYIITVYFFRKDQLAHLSPLDLIDLRSRTASTVHSIIVFFIILYVVISDLIGPQMMLKDPINAHRPETTFAMCIGLGYFISDFLLVMVLQLPPIIPMFFHHVFAIGAFVSIIVFKKFEFFVCLLYLAEGANPLYNIWWLCSRGVIKNKPLYQIVGRLFSISWIVCRLSLKPVVWYMLITNWPSIPPSTEPVMTMEWLWDRKQAWLEWSPCQSCLFSILANSIFLTFFDYCYFLIGPFIPLLLGNYDAPDSFGVFGDLPSDKDKGKAGKNGKGKTNTKDTEKPANPNASSPKKNKTNLNKKKQQ